MKNKVLDNNVITWDVRIYIVNILEIYNKKNNNVIKKMSID